MNRDKLFAIGDVAKMFGLSVSTLRHYEHIGLLSPEYVDPASGYRYYDARQFEVLNTICYLRALDMPLSEIGAFLHNRDVDKIEEMLMHQQAVVKQKRYELDVMARKIDIRLERLRGARNARLNEIEQIDAAPCRLIWLEEKLRLHTYLDMEQTVRRLSENQTERLAFLGKVGVGIAKEHLEQGAFEQYDCAFLVLDDVEQSCGDVLEVQGGPCLRVRFRGSHTQAPEQYNKLMAYMAEHEMRPAGFSREITLIDNGLTENREQFVTEITVPIEK